MKSRTLKILATALIAVGGVMFIAYQSVGDVQYYKHVEEIVPNPSTWLEKKSMQVHGFVVPGSIQEAIREQTTFRTFQLESKGKVLDVQHSGTKPDTFKDQAETVVKGRLTEKDGALLFVALDGEPGIMAKCPSKYNGQRR
jgi:cytochrome c-type biogenesis protein CcmE